MPPESITCPICKRTSWNPNDVRFQFCGNCNLFHADVVVELPIYVVTHNPLDFPGKYVTRVQWVTRQGGVIVSLEPVVVADTLHSAREVIPPELVRMDPAPNDDPVILETWL